MRLFVKTYALKVESRLTFVVDKKNVATVEIDSKSRDWLVSLRVAAEQFSKNNNNIPTVANLFFEDSKKSPNGWSKRPRNVTFNVPNQSLIIQ
jgi:hypothetical protein